MRRDRRDGRMADSLLALLSRDWIGVPVAVLVAGAGAGLAGAGMVWATALGALAMAVGVLLAVGAVRHLVLMAHERRDNPRRGGWSVWAAAGCMSSPRERPGTGRRWSGWPAGTPPVRTSRNCTPCCRPEPGRCWSTGSVRAGAMSGPSRERRRARRRNFGRRWREQGSNHPSCSSVIPSEGCWSRTRRGVGPIWWPVSCCSIRHPQRLSPSHRAAVSSRGCVVVSC